MREWKKIAIICALVLVVAAVATAVAGYFAYQRTVGEPVSQIDSIRFEPDSPINIGSQTEAVAVFKMPWSRRPLEAAVEVNNGLRQFDKPGFHIGKIGWGWCEWTVRVKLRAVRTGIQTGGKMIVTFNPGTEQTGSEVIFEQSLPSCRVKELPVSENDNLVIADAIELPPTKLHNRWLITGIALVVCAVVLLLIFIKKRRRRVLIVPPWIEALREIEMLRDGLMAGGYNLETGLGRLCDIVRIYLEKRFKLHTARQTTAEFMNELSRSGGVLPERHRPFLTDFLNSADLVKFAKVPPDEEMLRNAISSASALVNETKLPDIESKEVKS
ncbi:MAG: hypothetical protein PHV75_04020 [Victivallaceae bacterium]|jgi:hypothetical protein|nr:hypothetical protein [Victivallaceae bacterium]MDD3116190.1 hypothetical protein [Victivallaceae bacterium]MDD3702622.1 hypothetical protein [Victivallaceae bacterium]MDD4317664.1 hypothetical protein [Victivallaceae bacterium]MDD5664231.1 hypothetical protein [Victivallaceae bacterium]